MSGEIFFEPAAQAELDEATFWYETREAGLGDEFKAEVFAVLDRVKQAPEQFRHVGLTVRKVRLRRFSRYSIYYSVEPSRIGIVSIFHASRNPEELRRRLK